MNIKNLEYIDMDKFGRGDTVSIKKYYRNAWGNITPRGFLYFKNGIFLSIWNLRNYLYEKHYVSYRDKPIFGLLYDVNRKITFELTFNNDYIIHHKKTILSEKCNKKIISTLYVFGEK